VTTAGRLHCYGKCGKAENGKGDSGHANFGV